MATWAINLQVKPVDADGNASNLRCIGVPVEADSEGEAVLRFQQALAGLMAKLQREAKGK